MDPFRIAVRALAAYVFLLILLRIAGKRAIRHGSPFDFVLALVIGDLVDNAIWAEVPMLQFVVAASTLVLMKLVLTVRRLRSAGRRAAEMAPRLP
jgi:uncharacterized membrane protein YcaP (DUF421 family)